MTARNEGAGPAGLASTLVASGALQDDWLAAYQAAPRDMFVPDRIWPGIADGTRQHPVVDRAKDVDAWFAAVYSDIPLTTQWDDGSHTGDGVGETPSSSSSQPHMVFSMLADLGVEDGNRALEIGTGTGWNSALLAHRLGAENVVSIEFGAEIAKEARENHREAELSPLVVVRDGRLGYPEGAPFDRVEATCSIGEVPRSWIEQTLPGGLIVAPWGTPYGGEAIVRLTVDGDGASGPFTRSSAFMRLRQQRPGRLPHDAYLKGRPWPADGDRSRASLSPAAVEGWLAQFAVGLQMAEAFWTVERYDNGSYTLWTYSGDGQSWASADYEPGAESFEVVQSGPRRLWDATEAAHAWWDAQGRPDFERFGLTVSREGQRAWLDSPDNPVPVVR